MRRADFAGRGATAAALALAFGRATLADAASAPSLTIYHIPDTLLPDTAIPPDRLPSMQDVRTRVVRGTSAIAALQAALRAAAPVTIGPAAHSLDTRWSAIVAGTSGPHRIACDATGFEGMIDGRRVRFANPAVVVRLRRLFGA